MKFTVYFMKPVVTWNDVEAEDEKRAIAKCSEDPDMDVYSDGDPGQFVAIEESDDEDIPND